MKVVKGTILNILLNLLNFFPPKQYIIYSGTFYFVVFDKDRPGMWSDCQRVPECHPSQSSGRACLGLLSQAPGQEPGPGDSAGREGRDAEAGVRAAGKHRRGGAAGGSGCTTDPSGPWALAQEGSSVTFEGGKPCPKFAQPDVCQER